MATTSSSRRLSGKDRLAKPMRTASSPVIASPVSISSMARRSPSSTVWYCQSGGLATRTTG